MPNFVAAALLQYYRGLKWGALPVGFWTGWNCSVLPSIAFSVQIAMVVTLQKYRNAGCTGSGLHRNCKSQGAEPDESPYASCSPQLHPSGCNHFRTNRSKPYDRISCCREHLQYSWYRKPFRVDCIKANDYPVIMGITIFYAAFYMLIVLLVDLAYSLIDPRIRLAKGKES